MERRRNFGPLVGTVDWAQREIVLDVPEEAESIHYGFYLHGTGTTWVRNFELDRVGQEVPLTNRMKFLEKATNLNFSCLNSPDGEDSHPLAEKPSLGLE
jgi:hypothetical protein